MTTNKNKNRKPTPKRVSISHLALEVIEDVAKRYFELMIENFYNEENNRDLEMKIKLDLYEFLILNDFHIDDFSIIDNKATVNIHTLFTETMKAEYVLKVEMINNILIITDGELTALKRLRKRD